jgi:adenylylsulfate kinase
VAIVESCVVKSLRRDKGTVVWLTGLSGAGKSTVAREFVRYLNASGRRAHVLDGDELRTGLCSDLGYTHEEREENVRRAGEVAKILVDAGLIVVVALISPFAKDRQNVRKRFADNEFFEVYCACPIEVCEERDVKGLYRQARKGNIQEFTGVSSPYEVPLNPDIVLYSNREPLAESVRKLIGLLQRTGLLTASDAGMAA